jgi:hypothetical protein
MCIGGSRPGRVIGERHLVDREPSEALAQLRQLGLAHAGSDTTGKEELAAGIVAEEQSAEKRARAFRVGPADDDGNTTSEVGTSRVKKQRFARAPEWTRTPSWRRRWLGIEELGPERQSRSRSRRDYSTVNRLPQT